MDYNSPPASEHAPSPRPDVRRMSERKKLKRIKTKAYRDLKNLAIKWKRADRRSEKYWKWYERLIAAKCKLNEPSDKIKLPLEQR